MIFKVGQLIEVDLDPDGKTRRTLTEYSERDGRWRLDGGTMVRLERLENMCIAVPAPEDLAVGQVYRRHSRGVSFHGGIYGMSHALASDLRSDGWSIVGIVAGNGTMVRIGSTWDDGAGQQHRVVAVEGRVVRLQGGALVDVDLLVAAGREVMTAEGVYVIRAQEYGHSAQTACSSADPEPLAWFAAIGAAVAEQQRRARAVRALSREIIDSMIRGLSGPHARATAAVLMAAAERVNLTPVEAQATIAACEAWERRREEVAPCGPWGVVRTLDPVQSGCCAGESSEAAWKVLGEVRWFSGLEAVSPDLLLCEQGEWWIYDGAYEVARNEMMSALGIDDTPPPDPAIGQVWSDPDDGVGAWHVSDCKTDHDGTHLWKVGEIGGTSARWWSDEDFHRARFLMRATPMSPNCLAPLKAREDEVRP